ncbi:hypothetical protein [Haloechinothrix salitolerans]|uniref:Uncharacterized protein n=1 Tax=Haloechinothrix salitolerans TaxID=926830 RepID=A0ABW2C1H3_9PSEU
MDSARPLHEVFDALSDGALDDPVAALRDAGHDLPIDLIGDALAHYAGTADIAVAEHLAPFVTAHAAGEDVDPEAALALLASAPTGDLDDLDAADAEAGEALGIAFGTGSDDLDFGAGAATVDGAADEAGLVGLENAEPLPAPADVPEDSSVAALPELFGSGSPDETDAGATDGETDPGITDA